jgi:Protein of unknown function (DUF2393)
MASPDDTSPSKTNTNSTDTESALPGNGGGGGGFLSQQSPAEARSWLPWIVAGGVVLLGLVLVLFSGHRDRAREQADNAVQGPDPYAAKLSIGNLKMSEAENFAGGKVTYVDGEITNNGEKTVAGVQVTVTFKNDVGQPPQTVSMPLSLIRTREPYVDIEPVSAEPLKPGDMHEFRLIFDHISAVWNQQYPTIAPVRVQTR